MMPRFRYQLERSGWSYLGVNSFTLASHMGMALTLVVEIELLLVIITGFDSLLEDQEDMLGGALELKTPSLKPTNKNSVTPNKFEITLPWHWCRRSESNRHGVAPAGF